MSNAQLKEKAGFSANIITRLKRNEYVSIESVERICRVMECGVDDILEFVPEEKEGKEVNINSNDNNSSFSFPADAEKKEKIIFDFSLVLLSEGRPNAYNEAREAYGYNDATGWESEKTDTAGNVTKKKIRNKLAWIEAGWKRHNEQVFAPAHGQILADILRKTGMRPENADVINAFRGFRFEGDETNIAFLYTRKTAWQKFAAAITANDSVNKTVFGELTKVFPKVKQLHFTTY